MCCAHSMTLNTSAYGSLLLFPPFSNVSMRVVSPQAVRNLGSLAARADGLAGTVPSHQAYILLHSQHSPRSFPSRVASPLLVALQQRALRWSALVNVAWVPQNGVERAPNLSEDTNATETYNLLAFSRDRARLQVSPVSMDCLEDACAQLDDFLGHPTRSTVDPDAVYLYVCTHGARDCRCGEWGSKVADALREEILKRKASEPTGKYSRIVVGEVGHVGGHE